MITKSYIQQMTGQGLHIQVVVIMHRFQRGGFVFVSRNKGRARKSVPYLQCHHLSDT